MGMLTKLLSRTPANDFAQVAAVADAERSLVLASVRLFMLKSLIESCDQESQDELEVLTREYSEAEATMFERAKVVCLVRGVEP